MIYQRLFPLILLLTISACAAVNAIEPAMSSQPAVPDSSKEIDLHPPFPTQTLISEPIVIRPVDDETRESVVGEQMPVFLEVIQTTVMRENSGQGPSLGVGPNVYFYDPDNDVLSLNQAIVMEPDTELLIGVENILQTPNQEYTKREIVPYPSMQPVPIQVSSFDAETGTVTILYADEQIDLSPGESRTFKQVGQVNAASVITVISNHGHLAEIQPITGDGSWR